MKNKFLTVIIATVLTAMLLAGCGSGVSTAQTSADAQEPVAQTEEVQEVVEQPVEEHVHVWEDATYQAPKTCSECGETEGEPLEAIAEKLGISMNEKLNQPFEMQFPTTQEGVMTTARCEFKDYSCFEGDDNHEAVDGYVWQKASLVLDFWDENWWDYGFSFNNFICDYYLDIYDEETELYTINYNGQDYDAVKIAFDSDDTGFPDTDYWHNDVNDPLGRRTVTLYYYRRVPEGYDGTLLGIFNYDEYVKYDEEGELFDWPGISDENLVKTIKLPAANL